jgi:hypothetical protein
LEKTSTANRIFDGFCDGGFFRGYAIDPQCSLSAGFNLSEVFYAASLLKKSLISEQ